MKSPTKKKPVATLAERVNLGIALLEQLEALFPDLVELDAHARKHSLGKLRDGEADAMRAVLDAADGAPMYFTALATHDHGTNEKIFETNPSRRALDQRDELTRLHKIVRRFGLRLGDTLLDLGAEAREVTSPAYAIARVNATADMKLHSALAPAMKFYARGGRPKKA